MERCRKCLIELNIDNWHLSRQKRHEYICKECVISKGLENYYKNKEFILNKNKEKYREIKKEVLEYYGGKCLICGDKDLSILSLDHIDKNGRQHRKELGIRSGTEFYKWTLKNLPDNLRTLCYNCNCQTDMKKDNLVIRYDEKDKCKYCGDISWRKNSRFCAKCRNIDEKNKHIDLKLEIFSKYGNCCRFCNEKNIEYLTIDHINNDGARHRKDIGRDIYSWLKRNNFPRENFQTLCFNCNYLKWFNQI